MTPAGYRLALGLIVVLIVVVALATCGSNTSQEDRAKVLAERDQRIAVLETERGELEKKVRDMEQALSAPPAPVAAPPPPEAPCNARLAQLRVTLNKAFIDLKTAIVERDEYQKKLRALQSNTKKSTKP